MSPPPPLNLRQKKRLYEEELQSTAESHPMSTSKRLKRSGTDMDEQLPPFVFPDESHPEILNQIFFQMWKAMRYAKPYDDSNLTWEDDGLWEKIIENVKLPVIMSVHQFKLQLLSYYGTYEKGGFNALNLSSNTLAYVGNVFGKQRSSVGEYITNYMRPPPGYALEQYRESVTTVSHGPGSSGLIHPIQMIQSSSPRDIYSAFTQGLREIEDRLLVQEYKWARIHMAKHKGLVQMFCQCTLEERIQYVKDCYEEKRLDGLENVVQSQ